MRNNQQNNKPVLLVCVILLIWSVLVWADDLEDAKNAYGAGRFNEAANLLRPLVKQEIVEAVYLQAKMYEKGDGVAKDIKEAQRLYAIAAARGHEAARQKVDVFSVQSSDQSVVIEWYLPAAQEGDTEAQYNLGFMYETGWGVPSDTGEAIRWYTEASEMQHDVAQLRLAMMTITGVGTKASMKDGLELLYRSAENGNRIAEILVQDLFDVDGISDENAKQIVSGIRRIFDEGEAETIKILRRNLAELHKNPDEIFEPSLQKENVKNKTEDAEASVDVVKSVAKKSRVPKEVKSFTDNMRVSVGNDRKKIPVNVEKGNSYKWYTEHANNGEADAQYQLGVMYITGDQVEKDVEEGVYWMKLAMDQGHELASNYMELWQDDFDIDVTNSTIALSWLRSSARQWNQQSVFILGSLYEIGRGVEKNKKLAIQWYKFAASNGYSNAKRRLALMKKGGALLEQEGISRRNNSISSSGPSPIVVGIVALVFVFLIFVYVKFFKNRQNGNGPEQYQQKVVMDKAKQSQGLQADDRKFFDELWAAQSAKKPVTVRAEEPKKDVKPKTIIADGGKAKETVEPKTQAKPEKIIVKEKSKPEVLSQVEEKLAKAVEALISKEEDEKLSKVAQNEIIDGQKKEVVEQTRAKGENKNPDKIVSKFDGASDVFGQSEAVLGADNFMSVGISKDELAASRISADRLFADGVAIDEAGRAVGRGSYNPHKMDADSVLMDDILSISSQSVSRQENFDSVKPRPVGAAASLLPKKADIIKAPSIEPISFDIKSKPIVKKEIAGPLTNDEERSLAEVHYNIGLMFSSGDGVPKNDTQAAKWFLKAAEEGLPEGQFSLGQAYLNGSGMVKNTELALGWIQKAAENNYKPAVDMLKGRNKAI